MVGLVVLVEQEELAVTGEKLMACSCGTALLLQLKMISITSALDWDVPAGQVALVVQAEREETALP